MYYILQETVEEVLLVWIMPNLPRNQLNLVFTLPDIIPYVLLFCNKLIQAYMTLNKLWGRLGLLNYGYSTDTQTMWKSDICQLLRNKQIRDEREKCQVKYPIGHVSNMSRQKAFKKWHKTQHFKTFPLAFIS